MCAMADKDHMAELATHFFGSFTVQDLFRACALLRKHVGELAKLARALLASLGPVQRFSQGPLSHALRVVRTGCPVRCPVQVVRLIKPGRARVPASCDNCARLVNCTMATTR